VTDHGVNVLFRPVLGPEDFIALSAVLVRKLLVIQIMHEADDTPFFLVLPLFSGHVTHNPFHGEGMFNEALILVVFRKELKGVFSGRNFWAHFKTS
jgi:hypothetical protein